jgi:arylsulfatase
MESNVISTHEKSWLSYRGTYVLCLVGWFRYFGEGFLAVCCSCRRRHRVVVSNNEKNHLSHLIGQFFGKYHHLEPPPRHIPTFDEFITTPFSHFFKRGGVEKHITEWNEEDGLNYLRNKPVDQPFFLTVSFFATHAEDGSVEQYRPQESSMHLYQEKDVPLPKTYTEEHWKALPKFFDQYNFGRARFMHRYKTHDMYQHHMKNTYRMVTEVDTACGRIMDYLNETNQMENTMIIFTTDNGNLHGQHGLAEKWYAYQESIRVPLIIHDPRMLSKPAVITDFSLNVDLAPTILSAAGVAVPATMQGEDLADLYLRNKPGRKEFWYEFWDDNDGIPSSVALVQKDFKYIYWTDHNYHQAFNLTADPLEEHDLASTISADEYEKVKKRMVELQTYVRQDSGPRVFPASLQAIQ